ncbi:hypothetical protein FOS14_22300 [Skermania sp. ID1734]|uniref:sigma factor-like helix-turn-helix DNA-binding protein n=1 Tax=Skermania sp. ID1734 TaxID=2597516 RepID=UPI00117C596D|nr:sigma factor-like helix-turn-helix DNA-binding protein [Skermania sp. ID1734]TSD93792.1 hypothetical protein FOS14_22300 [Skermania sp. ID1734]
MRDFAVPYCRARRSGCWQREGADELAQRVCRVVMDRVGRSDTLTPRAFLRLLYSTTAAEIAHRPRNSMHTNAIGGALGSMPELQRQTLVLRIAVGLSTADTAAALDLPLASVQIFGHRALDRLRAAAA